MKCTSTERQPEAERTHTYYGTQSHITHHESRSRGKGSGTRQRLRHPDPHARPWCTLSRHSADNQNERIAFPHSHACTPGVSSRLATLPADFLPHLPQTARSIGSSERMHNGRKSQFRSLAGSHCGLRVCSVLTMTMKKMVRKKRIAMVAHRALLAIERPKKMSGMRKKQKKR